MLFMPASYFDNKIAFWRVCWEFRLNFINALNAMCDDVAKNGEVFNELKKALNNNKSIETMLERYENKAQIDKLKERKKELRAFFEFIEGYDKNSGVGNDEDFIDFKEWLFGELKRVLNLKENKDEALGEFKKVLDEIMLTLNKYKDGVFWEFRHALKIIEQKRTDLNKTDKDKHMADLRNAFNLDGIEKI